jgi:hypothetical protein
VSTKRLRLSRKLPGEHTNTRSLRLAGRNDPCPCGSGLKHKSCCLGVSERRIRAVPEPKPTTYSGPSMSPGIRMLWLAGAAALLGERFDQSAKAGKDGGR